MDDDFSDNPKHMRAGAAAVGVYSFGLSYVARNLTDGFIPTGAAAGLAASLGAGENEINALVREGLWEVTKNGYTVHDYLKYNPTKEVVEKKRLADAVRQGRHRSQPESRRDSRVTSTVSPTLPVPVPVPVPVSECNEDTVLEGGVGGGATRPSKGEKAGGFKKLFEVGE